MSAPATPRMSTPPPAELAVTSERGEARSGGDGDGDGDGDGERSPTGAPAAPLLSHISDAASGSSALNGNSASNQADGAESTSMVLAQLRTDVQVLKHKNRTLAQDVAKQTTATSELLEVAGTRRSRSAERELIQREERIMRMRCVSFSIFVCHEGLVCRRLLWFRMMAASEGRDACWGRRQVDTRFCLLGSTSGTQMRNSGPAAYQQAPCRKRTSGCPVV
jgi:hypothetical protein